MNIFTVAFFGHRIIERENGGAWQTINYAMRHDKTILNLAKEDEAVYLANLL